MRNFAETDLLTEDQKKQFAQGLYRALDCEKTEDGFKWNRSCSLLFADSEYVLRELGISSEFIKEVINGFLDDGCFCDCDIIKFIGEYVLEEIK